MNELNDIAHSKIILLILSWFSVRLNDLHNIQSMNTNKQPSDFSSSPSSSTSFLSSHHDMNQITDFMQPIDPVM